MAMLDSEIAPGESLFMYYLKTKISEGISTSYPAAAT